MVNIWTNIQEHHFSYCVFKVHISIQNIINLSFGIFHTGKKTYRGGSAAIRYCKVSTLCVKDTHCNSR